MVIGGNRILYLFVYLFAASAYVYCENCDNTSSVSLTLHQSRNMFPEVTATCTVTNSSDITWNYNGESSSCLVLCSSPNILCSNFNNVTASCTCGGSVITSQATFNLSCDAGVLVYCEGQQGVKVNVSGSLPSLAAPTLSGTYIDISDELFRVIVSWEEGDDAPPDVEYVVNVANESSQQPLQYPPTISKEMNIILHRGIEYTLSVTAQLCGGKIRSNSSIPLIVFLEVQIASSPIGLEPTIIVIKTEETQTLSSGQIAGVAIGVIILCVIILGVILMALILLGNKTKVSVVEQGEVKLMFTAIDHEGEESSGGEVGEHISDGLSYTGVGGICMDEDHLYYSCITKETSKKVLRICDHNGIPQNSLELSPYITGIEKDNRGFMYIHCKEGRLWKLDQRFNVIKKNNNKSAKYFTKAFGLTIVRDTFILLPASSGVDTNRICIFDLNMKHLYNINSFPFEPGSITKCDERYCIGGIGKIGVADIEFEEKECVVHTHEYYYTETNDKEKFPNYPLRGICTDGNYLYVTVAGSQLDKDLLCLKYESGKFNLYATTKYMCEDGCEDCHPLAIHHHQSKIIYSQGTREGLYHIVELHWKDNKTLVSTKLSNV